MIFYEDIVMKKLLLLTSFCLCVFSIQAQKTNIKTLSPNSFYNYLFLKLDPKTDNFDAIIADIFVKLKLTDQDEIKDELAVIQREYPTRYSNIDKFITQFEVIDKAGGIEKFLSAKDELKKCQDVTTAFGTFKQAVNTKEVPAIKSTWQGYRTALQAANMAMDAADKNIDAKVNALTEKQPTQAPQGVTQLWQNMNTTKEALENINYDQSNPAFKETWDKFAAAVSAVDIGAKSASLSEDQKKMLIVAKSVVNVTDNKKVYTDLPAMTAGEVLDLVTELAAPTNITVRNAIAAGYCALDENDTGKAKLEKDFEAKFKMPAGKPLNIQAQGLAIVVPMLKDKDLIDKWDMLKACNPMFATYDVPEKTP